MPNITALSRKEDQKNGRKAHLIVVLKINNLDTGEVLQALIFLKSAIIIKFFGWTVDTSGNVLKRLANELNSLEEAPIRKWHFNRDKNNIVLIFPTKLTQHDIIRTIKNCMEKIT